MWPGRGAKFKPAPCSVRMNQHSTLAVTEPQTAYAMEPLWSAKDGRAEVRTQVYPLTSLASQGPKPQWDSEQVKTGKSKKINKCIHLRIYGLAGQGSKCLYLYPTTQEAKAVQASLHRKFQTSQDYSTRPCPEIKMTQVSWYIV